MINCRVVFDTNIFISAILSPTGKPFQCSALAKRNIIKSVTCEEILGELQDKLISKFAYHQSKAKLLIDEIREYSELVKSS